MVTTATRFDLSTRTFGMAALLGETEGRPLG
jgi:hypothetical protein